MDEKNVEQKSRMVVIVIVSLVEVVLIGFAVVATWMAVTQRTMTGTPALTWGILGAGLWLAAGLLLFKTIMKRTD